MSTPLQTDSSRTRLHLLAAILFVSYLCVAIPLPVIPVFVTHRLGLDNVWAGLGVGIAFLSTIFTRGYAGNLADRLGAKTAVVRGMLLYAGGAAISLLAGFAGAPWAAFGTLVLGRLLLGLGESLVGVGIITWGVGLVGPARSGQVLALVGAAIYGAFALGGPIGLVLLERVGFSGTMAVSALLPCIGLAVVAGLAGIAPHPHGKRPSFASVVGRLWLHGLVVCLQGIGFAAIGAFFALDFLHNGWHYAGLGLTAFGVGFVLVRVLFGHLPDRVGGLPVAIGSLAVETVGQLMIWSANDPGLALAGAFLTGLGCSMVFPAMGREVVHLVAPHLRGAAMGAYAAFQDLAYGLTGPVAGMLADRSGYGGVFLAGGVAALIGMLVVLYLQRVRAPVAQ
ncbi:arabinose transporter [Burkholderia plantarii]|uniref:arabinose transporter n=1 Tax=Burkholderia plantarii TaxID=41899 RepID=UPI00272D3945|nr:arabinose transporter [Burkholderia plantarii]WLE62000.1 arabinose transporter [Burkholderia plantarii]